jgi:outer membrane protein OmpA-like peptidoglycan-associated protein
MFRILPLIFTTVVLGLVCVETSGAGSPAVTMGSPSAIRSQEISFNIFFDSGKASLTDEGRELVAAAAKQFARDHGRDAHIFLIGNADSASDGALSKDHIVAVRSELVHDGVRLGSISAKQSPRAQSMPITLQEWENRRVIIAVRANAAFADRL